MEQICIIWCLNIIEIGKGSDELPIFWIYNTQHDDSQCSKIKDNQIKTLG